MSPAPREEAEIKKDIAAVRSRISALEAEAALWPFDKAREQLEQMAARAEAARLDSAIAWNPPPWARHPMLNNPRRAAAEAREALRALKRLERQGGGPDAAIPCALAEHGRSHGVEWWRAKRRDDARIEELRKQLEELERELAFRQLGPGERLPYRLTTGGHCRWEDGKPRQYRAGATIRLDNFELAALGRHRVEPLAG